MFEICVPGSCLHRGGEDNFVEGIRAEEEGRVEEVLPQRRLPRPVQVAVAARAVVKTVAGTALRSCLRSHSSQNPTS